VQKVYNAYRKWCETSGYNALNISQLGQRIQNVFPMVKKTRPSRNNVRENYYKFLKIRPDSEIANYLYEQMNTFFS
jgi:phage/plasmid-associated DNA primase